MKKEIIFRPAWDKRHQEPSKNYGIHGVEMVFLYGDEDKGFVQFVVYTNWLLPETEQEFITNMESCMVVHRYPFTYLQKPMPADVGYHSPSQTYEGQDPMDCHLLKCGKCYYDGSTMAADDVFTVLLREGSEGVWKHLETKWNQHFGHSCQKILVK